MTKQARIYNRKKTVSQTKDVRKTGQLHVKESTHTTCGCGKKGCTVGWNINWYSPYGK